MTFAPDKTRVAEIRCITGAFTQLCGVQDSLAADVVLAVSELVTNAIQHGGGSVALRVRHGHDELRVEVNDGSSVAAELRVPRPCDESGRGLFLVDAVASSWGVSDDGRVTWCAFEAPTGRV
ncbi:ATP-binding protein [Streptomyces sp. NPDC001691]|uniref:ATP-binding protein n=1 Tax=Streptomyces sp. NPDC001691 TaxID=3364600 RepID=UPI0036C517D7